MKIYCSKSCLLPLNGPLVVIKAFDDSSLSVLRLVLALEICSIQRSQNRRIIAWFELEGNFKGHLVQSPCNEQGHRQLDQVSQSPIQPDLECSRDGALTTSSGNQCQCFTTLIVKNFFLMSSLNLPSLSLKPLPLVLLLQALLKSLSSSFLQVPLKY